MGGCKRLAQEQGYSRSGDPRDQCAYPVGGGAAILMIGGAYLCYEGFEKIAHKFKHDAAEDAHRAEHLQALANPTVDLLAIEKEKIQGAIRTDFILSAEIVVIALGCHE